MFFWGFFVSGVVSIPAESSALCGAAKAMVQSADLHLVAWNRQLEVLTPGNCTQVYQFLYASHVRVLEGLRTELDVLHGNLSEISVVSSTAAASSLLSAQMHGISFMRTNFRSCFEAADVDRDLSLMALVLLRHAKTLLPSELRAVWISLQDGIAPANPEKSLQANLQFIQRAADVFAADLPVLGTVVKRNIEENPPKPEGKKFPISRMSLVDAIYEDTFRGEPKIGNSPNGPEIFRGLFKGRVLEKDDKIADFAAAFGNFIDPLRESGLFAAVDAFDAIDDVDLATHDKVQNLGDDAKIGNYKTVFALGVFDMTQEVEIFFLEKIKKHAERFVVTDFAHEDVLRKFLPEFSENTELTTTVRESLSENDLMKSSIRVLQRTPNL